MSAFAPKQLPPELILHILDHLALSDIRRAGQTCRAWRMVARAHPAFACRIRLIAMKENQVFDRAVDFFLDRLSAVCGGNLDLHIVLVGFGRKVKAKRIVRNTVIPALKASLWRMTTLSIRCEEGFIPDLFSALASGPAPRLTEFSFSSTLEHGTIKHTLPMDIFAAHAPRLCGIEVNSCHFPEIAIPVFARVRKFARHLDFQGQPQGALELRPERWFVHCPALEELDIWGSMCPVRVASWDACPPVDVTKLRRLTVTGVESAEDTHSVVCALAHAGMESVDLDTTRVGRATLDLLLAHFDSDDADDQRLELDVVQDDHKVSISIYDAARARRRTLSHAEDSEYYALLHRPGRRIAEVVAPCFARIAPRIVRISLLGQADPWSCILGLFDSKTSPPSLSGVETLTLLLYDGLFTGLYGCEDHPGASLTLPALRRLELVYEGDDRVFQVKAEQLIFLAGTMLKFGKDRKLKLGMKNAYIVGTVKWGLADYFDEQFVQDDFIVRLIQ